MNKINIDVNGPIYPVTLKSIPPMNANKRFEAGPANAIFIMSTLGFAKYLESTGRGLPNQNQQIESSLSRKGLNEQVD